jgi:hypothetical protein
MYNLFPESVGRKTVVWNKTKQQSVEQQEVLMFLFPWMNVPIKKMRSDRREKVEKRPGNAAPGTVGFRSTGIVRAIATEAGSSIS